MSLIRNAFRSRDRTGGGAHGVSEERAPTLRLARARARVIAARADRKWRGFRSDIEMRQLRSLQRAYGGRHGPDVLIFGDSAMYWTRHRERDPRRLCDMIRDELRTDGTVKVLCGPGYHARIVIAFLAALAECRSRPRVVVVPTSVIMTTSGWFNHPKVSYEAEAEDLNAAIRDGRKPRRLARTPSDAADAYDRRRAPSLFGRNSTFGELRMLNDAPAETPWQKEVRHRYRLDYYNAERLEFTSAGVQRVADLAHALAGMDLPAVAYILPVRRGDLAELGGQIAIDQIAHNANVISTVFSEAVGDAGRVVNAIFAAADEDFIDPLHLGPGGRRLLAAQIASAIRRFL